MSGPLTGITPLKRDDSSIAEIIRDARGKQSLDILYPRSSSPTYKDDLGPVTIFKNDKDTSLFVRSRVEQALGKSLIEDSPLDTFEFDPITMLMSYRRSINGKGQDNVRMIGIQLTVGANPGLGSSTDEPKKRGFFGRIIHPFGG